MKVLTVYYGKNNYYIPVQRAKELMKKCKHTDYINKHLPDGIYLEYVEYEE